jgi:hypothetical protein
MPSMKLVSIVTATDGKHKYTANIKDGDGKMHKVHFGAQGYSDYTKHKDPERKRRYITRHQKTENWTKSGILTAGFWSRWVLWNLPSFRDSIADTKRRFNL